MTSENSRWRRLKLPKSRNGRIALAVGVVIFLAIGAATSNGAPKTVATPVAQTAVAAATSSGSSSSAASTTNTPTSTKTTVRTPPALTHASVQPSATSSKPSTSRPAEPQTSSDARMEFYNHAETNAFGVSHADVDKLGNGICADLKDSWAPSNPGPGKAGLGYFNERDALAKLKFAAADADVMIQDAVIGYCPDQTSMLVQAMARLTKAVQSTALGVAELPAGTR